MRIFHRLIDFTDSESGKHLNPAAVGLDFRLRDALELVPEGSIEIQIEHVDVNGHHEKVPEQTRGADAGR